MFVINNKEKALYLSTIMYVYKEKWEMSGNKPNIERARARIKEVGREEQQALRNHVVYQ